jgi:hypothetical protein
MGEIVPGIAEGRRILLKEFPPALFVRLPVSSGNFSADFFLVFQV